jgi:acyl-CoA synthetase (AMP-forming)/AMP-acid ligase II
VLKQEDAQGAVKLIGFLKRDEGFDVAQIQAEMAKRLPAHMLLAKICIVDDYPYLVSGKVNKRELLARYSLSD